MKCKILNNSAHPLPAAATELSAGMDLRANLSEEVTMPPLQRALIPTGLFIELPKGYEAQVRPRSGLAIKNGVTVINAPGTIDADYRGEIKVALVNLSDQPFTVHDGDRVAQLVVAKHEIVEWEPANELSETERAANGFGSTGH